MLLKFSQDWADEFNVPALDCKNHEDYKKWCRTKMSVNGISGIRAHLGNSGDDFERDYDDILDGQGFIDSGIVKVLEVDESFYKSFHKLHLNYLSLCNIFEPEEIEEMNFKTALDVVTEILAETPGWSKINEAVEIAIEHLGYEESDYSLRARENTPSDVDRLNVLRELEDFIDKL